MKRLLLSLAIVVCFISCGSDDESERKKPIEVNIQYLSSLYDLSYSKFKASNIGTIKEESEVYSDIENPVKGTAIITDIYIEGYKMIAHYYIFDNKTVEIGLSTSFHSNAEGVECYKKITKSAYNYWGNPSIQTLIKGEAYPKEIKSTYDNYWNKDFQIESVQTVNMNFKDYPLIYCSYNARVNEYPSIVDVTIGGLGE